MGQAGVGLAADNVATGRLEFSPPPAAHGNLATSTLYQSISGSSFFPGISPNSSHSACGKIVASTYLRNHDAHTHRACILSGSPHYIRRRLRK